MDHSSRMEYLISDRRVWEGMISECYDVYPIRELPDGVPKKLYEFSKLARTNYEALAEVVADWKPSSFKNEASKVKAAMDSIQHQQYEKVYTRAPSHNLLSIHCIWHSLKMSVSHGEEIPVPGILIEGFTCTVMTMDMRYQGVYRLIPLGTFYISRTHTDFSVLDDAFETMLTVNTLVETNAATLFQLVVIDRDRNAARNMRRIGLNYMIMDGDQDIALYLCAVHN
ncbi:hypothetical protein BJV82DRAFT_662676 [Fennellomyces sp. T-0311]|nr:hypothetical protein BJV82DRAFT_662676 [Fennellomyces sp. T-0311]